MREGISAIAQLNVDVLFAGFGGYPALGEENHARRFGMQLGGGPQATLLRLHQLGLPTRLGTFFADDTQSRLALQLLEEFGYHDYENLYAGNGHPTVVTSVFSFAEDRAFITYNEGASAKDMPDDAVYAFLKDAKICYAPENLHVLRRLKEDGVLLVFDAAWDNGLCLERYADVLRYVDVFTPNDKEAMKMTGAATPGVALLRLAEVVRCPVVKIGQEGCLILAEGNVVHVPALSGLTCVDTTGAGDSFLAGLIYGLYQGWNMLDCVRMGNVMGGHAITGLGCLAAPIDAQQAMALFARHYGSR